MGLSYAEVGRRLIVHPTTVSRTVQLFEETGTVCSIQGYHENTHKKLSSCDELAIIEAVLDNPSMYLHEMRMLYFKQLALKSLHQLSASFFINRDFHEKS